MISTTSRSALSILTLLAMLGLVGCGSEESTTSADAATETTSAETESEPDAEGDEDHGDQNHGDEDEDHGDEDEDHGDEDHGDEDQDHGDEGEDHKDDDHGDEDHDDHDDHDDSSGGLGAHEHGTAELSAAWSDGTMIIDLVSPTFNIFGFEYEAETADDKDIVADGTEALIAPGVLAINEEAGCELVDDVTTELEYEGSHAELTASWMFECSDPDNINQLDATVLFDEFPNFEDIDAQWASDSAQSSAELSPSSTVLSFE